MAILCCTALDDAVSNNYIVPSGAVSRQWSAMFADQSEWEKYAKYWLDEQIIHYCPFCGERL